MISQAISNHTYCLTYSGAGSEVTTLGLIATVQLIRQTTLFEIVLKVRTVTIAF